jgi:glutathione synthase/RimK-type ligase-like ATP-grasp enzyme
LLIALATTAAARERDVDHAPLAAALARRGLVAEAPAWDDPGVDWRRYALVLPRSTWNYPDDLAAFLAWAERVARVTRLENPPATLRFSADKRYLAELARAGVAVVPSTFSVAAADWSPPAAPDYVVKPAVGADGRGTRRFAAGETEAARAHAAALAAQGLAVLTQPYLAAIDAEGESALVYLEGRFSHAVRKAPLLDAGTRAAALLDVATSISARAARDEERAVAAAALAAVPGGPPFYARVDLVRDAAGDPCVLELELVEPSLFLDFAPGSADRFAACIAARVAA